MRRFFVDNALMWLNNYHCDSLRFDAVHALIDLSAVHFMKQISLEVESLGATLSLEFFQVAESDLNEDFGSFGDLHRAPKRWHKDADVSSLRSDSTVIYRDREFEDI